MTTEIVPRRQSGATFVVAATGPSLTAEVATQCRVPGWRAIAVNDAWRLFQWADALYACDAAWWVKHDGVPAFRGERWSTHDDGTNEKAHIARRFGLRCVAGAPGETFSRDQGVIHYGSNSGFQAINLAILFGARRIVLVGFDMQTVDGRRHFFGDHPAPLRNAMDYRSMVPIFHKAARSLDPGVQIINATPSSAITCWPRMTIADAVTSCEVAYA